MLLSQVPWFSGGQCDRCTLMTVWLTLQNVLYTRRVVCGVRHKERCANSLLADWQQKGISCTHCGRRVIWQAYRSRYIQNYSREPLKRDAIYKKIWCKNSSTTQTRRRNHLNWRRHTWTKICTLSVKSRHVNIFCKLIIIFHRGINKIDLVPLWDWGMCC